MVRKEIPYCRPVFLKLGSTKGCHGFQETKVHNGGRVLLAVLNLSVRIKISVVTFHTNHFVTDSTQSIAASIKKLPDSVVNQQSSL